MEKNNKIKIAGVTTENKGDRNIILSSNKDASILPFFKDEKYILDNISFIKFIKNVEMQIRTSIEYKSYIKYLKEELNLNHCMVYSNITDSVAPIEMHHFLLTLYDYVEIIIGWCFKSKIEFSSSKIFGILMEEHRLNNILVMMLSRAVHIAIHNKNKNDEKRFLDYRMAHGNISEFLQKYYLGLSFNHILKIKRYMEQYEKQMKNPPEKFFNEYVTKWTKEVMI